VSSQSPSRDARFGSPRSQLSLLARDQVFSRIARYPVGLGVLDTDHYPTLAAYLDGLPDGIDSHPACQAKASLHRSALETAPLPVEDIARLPNALIELLEHPVPVSSWIPEVHNHALLLAIYDRVFVDIEAFARHAYSTQRALFEGPLYAIAFRIASPELLIKTAGLRWRMFHRGITFKPVMDGKGHGRVQLDFPAGIYHPVLLRSLCEALRATLELATAKDAQVETARCGSTTATLSCRWH